MQAIADLAEANGGMVTTAQVVGAGIPRARISDMVKSGELERVQRGVYRLADAWEDEFLAAQLRLPKGVFSDGTALYLHGYTDRTPFQLTIQQLRPLGLADVQRLQQARGRHRRHLPRRRAGASSWPRGGSAPSASTWAWASRRGTP